MDKIVSQIKAPLYRVIVNLAVGVIAILILHDHFPFKNGVQLLQLKPPYQCLFFKWYFVIPVVLVVGEIFSFAGEMIINLFFEYTPFREPEKDKDSVELERIFPCSSTYLRYKSFVNNHGADFAFEISEVHFVLSRLFAGLMVIAIGTVCLYWSFMIGCVIFILSSFHVSWKKWDESSKKEGAFYYIFKKLLCCVFAFIVVFCINIAFPKICDHCTNYNFLPIAAFCALASVYYRAHANQILHEVECIPPSDQSKKTNGSN